MNYRAPVRPSAPLPRAVATRIEEEDFARLAELAHKRRLSVATVVRDAVAFYLAAGAPPPEDPQ